MKILKINDAAYNSRIITRKAWIIIDEDAHGLGIRTVRDCSLKPKKGYEEVRLQYPQYVCGRQGEAQYVHLPSYPDRLTWRALTGSLSDE